MSGRYIFKFATKKAGCKGPDIYNGDVIWDESDGPVHLKFWSGNEYVRLSDMVRNEVDKYMKETNRMNDRPTPETDALDHELHSPCVLQDRYSEMRDHARKMERERDEAREKYFVMRDAHNNVAAIAEKYRRERDEVREERDIARLEVEEISQDLADAKKQIAGLNNFANERFDEIQKVRKERDELREAAAKWEAVALREASINGARIFGKEAAK